MVLQEPSEKRPTNGNSELLAVFLQLTWTSCSFYIANWSQTDNNTLTDNNTPIQKVQLFTKTLDGVLLSIFEQGCY